MQVNMFVLAHLHRFARKAAPECCRTTRYICFHYFVLTGYEGKKASSADDINGRPAHSAQTENSIIVLVPDLDEKCISAILPATEHCSECELIILDTDCDEWHTFVFEKGARRFEETYPLARTVAKTEDAAKHVVLLNALILRGEPVSAGELPKSVATYLPGLIWKPGYDRSRLPIEMS